MNRLRGLWPLAVTFVLGVAGLLVPGAAGDVAAFVWLGLFPGLALTRLLLPGTSAVTRWTLGAVLGPLAAAVAGWALVRAGQPLTVAARVVSLGGWVLFAGGEARAMVAPRASEADAPGDRVAWLWILAAAAFVALPEISNVYLRVRSDSWVHAGLAFELFERGLPPQDPRFAGLPLNYVWFYNLFVAMLLGLRPGSSPFTHMAVANVCWIAAQVALAWQLAWATWRERAAARATLPLLLTGLNAGALLLWPLWFLRAVGGEITGMAEVRRIVETARWDRADVLHQLCAPYAWMVNTWDKYVIGTSLGYAYVLALAALWAGVRWLSDPRGEAAAGPPPWRWLLVAFVAAAGAMLFHSVVGLSLVPVAAGACVLLALLAARDARLGPPSRPLALAFALVAGLAVTWPYFRSISSGWSVEHSGFQHHYLQFGWRMPWTIATSCGVALLAAWPGLTRALREARTGAVWLTCFALGMTLFALVVHLPESNEHKFTWLVFAPLAVLGGPGLPALLAGARRRLGTPLAALIGFVAFVLPALLFQYGYLSDRPGAGAPELARAAGEPRLYAWVREHTPVNAVFVDNHSRDLLLVEGRRRLLAGTPFGPERAAFPREELLRRRAVMADLYGPTADLAGDAAHLDSLGAPAYVLYRAADFAGASPWTALDADRARFERVYDADGFLVYRRRP